MVTVRPDIDPERLFFSTEAAEILGVCKRTVINKIPGRKTRIGNRHYYKGQALLDYWDAHFSEPEDNTGIEQEREKVKRENEEWQRKKKELGWS